MTQPGVTSPQPGVYEISLTLDSNPVILTATLEDANGRVRLEVDAPSPGAKVTITRKHPSNTVWTVRGVSLAALSGGIWFGYDYEIPPGRLVTYKATVYQSDGTTVTGTSDDVEILWDTVSTWLKDPLAPAANMPVTVNTSWQEDFSAPTGVNPVLGSPTPVVLSEVRQAATGQIPIVTLDLDEAGTLHLLTSTGRVLLLQTHPSFGVGNLYFALQSVSEGRTSPYGAEESRIWTLNYVEVAPPIGDPVGGAVTWQQVIDGYATWSAVVAEETSWLDLLQGVNTLGGTQPRPTLSWRGA